MKLSKPKMSMLGQIEKYNFHSNCLGGHEMRTVNALLESRYIIDNDICYELTKTGRDILINATK